MKEIKIIVEGPDGSGKTELAYRLAKSLGKLVYHSGGPISDTKELHNRIKKQLNIGSTHIIDRCTVFSEPVYGVTLRGHSLLSRSMFDIYIKKMYKMGYIVIQCKAKGIIEQGKSWKSEDHMKGVLHKSEYIHKSYATIIGRAKSMGLTIVTWDWKKFNNKLEEGIAYRWILWGLGCVE